MSAKEWLEINEWENVNVDSSIYPHYTKLDKIMEEYAKHYLKEHLKHTSDKIKFEKYL
jgi:hypothetical protein